MSGHHRRQFLRYLASTPLLGQTRVPGTMSSPADAINVMDFLTAAEKKIAPQHFAYLMTGVDDNRTVAANEAAFQLFQIRARRFIDTLMVDTSVEIFGRRYPSPVLIAPTGSQQAYHAQGELTVARAARAKSAQMILSTVTSFHVRDVAREYAAPLWFQLYPTPDFDITRHLIRQAEEAGCPVLMVTVDSPTASNREFLRRRFPKSLPQCRACHGPAPQDFFREHAMFEGVDISRLTTLHRPVTWELLDRIRAITKMKLMVKGIVTAEDAALCVKHGLDGIVVSNHGGRQEESLMGTMECLPEIVDAVGGKFPLLMDGGIRRGTDIFKALAVGADAVCIGRPYLWGLGAFGQPGVERVLELLQLELATTMKMAGTPSIRDITKAFVRRRPA